MSWEERWPMERRVHLILTLPPRYIDIMFEEIMREEFVR